MLHFLLGDIPKFPSRNFAWWFAKKCGGYVMVVSTVATWFGKPGNPLEWGKWGIAHPPNGDDVWRALVLLIGIILITGDPRQSIPNLFRRRQTETSTLTPASSMTDPPELVQFTRAWLLPPVELAIDVLRSVNAPMARMGETVAHYGILLDRAIVEQANNSRIAMINRLNGQDTTSLDERAADLYQKYQWVLTWIVQGGKDVSFLWNIPRIEEWIERDAELHRRLEELVAHPDFSNSRLAHGVTEVGRGESVRREIKTLFQDARMKV